VVMVFSLPGAACDVNVVHGAHWRGIGSNAHENEMLKLSILLCSNSKQRNTNSRGLSFTLYYVIGHVKGVLISTSYWLSLNYQTVSTAPVSKGVIIFLHLFFP